MEKYCVPDKPQKIPNQLMEYEFQEKRQKEIWLHICFLKKLFWRVGNKASSVFLSVDL